MKKSIGHDIFTDNTYSCNDWSAESLYSPQKVTDKLGELDIVGRTIVDVKAIGGSYNAGWYPFYTPETRQKRYLADVPEKEVQNDSRFECCVHLDEPFVLILDNGDHLEIYFPLESYARISKNCFPHDLKHEVIPCDFDAPKLFAACIGQSIQGFFVNTTTRIPEFQWCEPEKYPSKGEEFIDSIDLLLGNGFRMQFFPDTTFFCVMMLNSEGKIITMLDHEFDEIFE